jgi:hypothetical protein
MKCILFYTVRQHRQKNVNLSQIYQFTTKRAAYFTFKQMHSYSVMFWTIWYNNKTYELCHFILRIISHKWMKSCLSIVPLKTMDIILYDGVVFRKITTAISPVLIVSFSSLWKLNCCHAVKKWQSGCLTFQQKTWESYCKTAQFFPELIWQKPSTVYRLYCLCCCLPVSVKKILLGSQSLDTSHSLPGSNLHLAHTNNIGQTVVISFYLLFSQIIQFCTENHKFHILMNGTHTNCIPIHCTVFWS